MVVFKRKEFGSKLIFFQLMYIVVYNLLTDYLSLPNAVSYLVDLINIAVFIWLLIYRRTFIDLYRLRLQYVLYAVFLLIAVAWMTALLNAVSPMLVLWSTRNALRFFPFFFAVIIFWDKRSADIFSRALILLQIPNLLLCLFQFYIEDLRGDYLGGIFGKEQGCNAYLNIFLMVVVTLVVEKYLHGRINVVITGATCLSALLLAAMAELKILFVMVPLIIIASFVLNKPTLKTVLLAVLISIGLVIAVNLIVIFFPSREDTFSSLKSLLNVGKETTGGYYLPRFGAFSAINEYFFHGSPVRNLIGFGFGNCDYSHFDFLTSDFFLKYGASNYQWFSHMMWFLQTGYLGIFAYAIFILSVFFWITGMKMRFGDPNGIGSFGQIMCGVMIANFAYNSAFISDCGFFLFAPLALSIVYYKEIFFNWQKSGGQKAPIPEEIIHPEEAAIFPAEPQEEAEESPFYFRKAEP